MSAQCDRSVRLFFFQPVLFSKPPGRCMSAAYVDHDVMSFAASAGLLCRAARRTSFASPMPGSRRLRGSVRLPGGHGCFEEAGLTPRALCRDTLGGRCLSLVSIQLCKETTEAVSHLPPVVLWPQQQLGRALASSLWQWPWHAATCHRDPFFSLRSHVVPLLPGDAILAGPTVLVLGRGASRNSAAARKTFHLLAFAFVLVFAFAFVWTSRRLRVLVTRFWESRRGAWAFRATTSCVLRTRSPSHGISPGDETSHGICHDLVNGDVDPVAWNPSSPFVRSWSGRCPFVCPFCVASSLSCPAARQSQPPSQRTSPPRLCRGRISRTHRHPSHSKKLQAFSPEEKMGICCPCTWRREKEASEVYIYIYYIIYAWHIRFIHSGRKYNITCIHGTCR